MSNTLNQPLVEPVKILTLFNRWKPVVLLILGFQISLGGAIWTGAWYISTTLNTVANTQANLERDMRELEESATKDRYTLTAASEKALRTALENPGMRVPDPRDPSKIIVVNTTAAVEVMIAEEGS